MLLTKELKKCNKETKLIFELIQVENEITKEITHFGKAKKSLLNKEQKIFLELEKHFNIDTKQLQFLLENFI